MASTRSASNTAHVSRADEDFILAPRLLNFAEKENGLAMNRECYEENQGPVELQLGRSKISGETEKIDPVRSV